MCLFTSGDKLTRKYLFLWPWWWLFRSHRPRQICSYRHEFNVVTLARLFLSLSNIFIREQSFMRHRSCINTTRKKKLIQKRENRSENYVIYLYKTHFCGMWWKKWCVCCVRPSSWTSLIYLFGWITKEFVKTNKHKSRVSQNWKMNTRRKWLSVRYFFFVWFPITKINKTTKKNIAVNIFQVILFTCRIVFPLLPTNFPVYVSYRYQQENIWFPVLFI